MWLYISLPGVMFQIIWIFLAMKHTYIIIINHIHYTPYINQLFPSFQVNSISLSLSLHKSFSLSSLFFSFHRCQQTIPNINKSLFHTSSPFLNQNYMQTHTTHHKKNNVHKRRDSQEQRCNQKSQRGFYISFAQEIKKPYFGV